MECELCSHSFYWTLLFTVAANIYYLTDMNNLSKHTPYCAQESMNGNHAVNRSDRSTQLGPICKKNCTIGMVLEQSIKIRHQSKSKSIMTKGRWFLTNHIIRATVNFSQENECSVCVVGDVTPHIKRSL